MLVAPSLLYPACKIYDELLLVVVVLLLLLLELLLLLVLLLLWLVLLLSLKFYQYSFYWQASGRYGATHVSRAILPGGYCTYLICLTNHSKVADASFSQC